MNEDGVIRPEVGAVGDSDGVRRLRPVITDSAALMTNRTGGGRENKVNSEVSDRRHREGERHLMLGRRTYAGRLSHLRTLPCEANGRNNWLVVSWNGDDVLRGCAKHPPRRQTLLRKFNRDSLVFFYYSITEDDDGISYRSVVKVRLFNLQFRV